MKTKLWAVKTGRGYLQTLHIVKAKTKEEAEEIAKKDADADSYGNEIDEQFTTALNMRKKVVFVEYIGE